MKTGILSSFSVFLTIGAIGSLLLSGVTPLRAQTDDFNDGNDDGWTRYSPLAACCGVPGFFTFPNGGYRIETRTPTGSAQNPGRVGTLRMDAVYTNFYVSVDVVDWKDNTRQAFGILARLQTVGLQTTKGYAFTFERGSGVTATSGATDISRITGEVPTGLTTTGTDTYHLNTNKDYRLVFIGRGTSFEGRIYELPNVTTPVLTITGSDTTYTSGYCGLVAYDNSGGLGVTDVTFDNYFATDMEPPTLNFELNPSFNEFTVSWPLSYSAWTLQGTSSLVSPISWTDIPASVGDKYYYTESSITGLKFFRLKK